MKRLNTDQINTFVRNFLKRRNYNDNNLSKVNRKPNKLKSIDMKSNNGLEEVAITGSVLNTSSDSDVIALSQSSGEFTSLAENSFKHFIEFTAKFKAKQRVFEQLSQLEFPLFLYVFIELFECGYKISARRFFRDHKSRFKDTNELQIIEVMNKSLNSISIDLSLKTYKTNKFCVKISDKCLEQLKKYFKETKDLVIIQIFNTFIEFNIYSTHSQTETEKRVDSVNSVLNKCSQYNDLELIPSNLKTMDSNTNDNDIVKCIERVRNSQPCLPSICCYTITTSDLNCVSVTDDMVTIAMGYEKSFIRLKSLDKNVSNIESDIEVKRKTSEIEFNLIDYNIEDNNQSVNNDNNCDNNTSHSTQNSSYRLLSGHSGPVYGLTFVPRSNLLLSCSCDTTVRAWDTTNGNNVAVYNSHSSPVWTIDSSFIGNYFCTGSKDSAAYLWSIERSFPLRMFFGHNMSVDCIRFHPNCNFIATASADKEIKVWDIQSARAVRTLIGHKAAIYSLCFSSCGKYMASAGEDRNVMVWDIKSGELVNEFSGHSDTVYSICFNHNNTVLSSCGADQSLKLWNIKNTSNKPLVSDSDNSQNIGRKDTDQLMSYQLDGNAIHTQFMPKNLLLSIATKMPLN